MDTVNANGKTEEFFSRYTLRTYPKGQILLHAGENPNNIFYIASGKVRQYDISYRGDELIVNIFKPGAFFPMLWALTKIDNKYFYSADSELAVRIVPVSDTIEFLKSNPDELFTLLTRVYIGIDGVLGRLVQLMASSARGRVLFELVLECRRFGEKFADGSCEIKINEQDLAARTGLSRETVSREMQNINRGHILKISHNSIKIHNLKRLEGILEATR